MPNRALLVVPLLFAATATAADWPRFRGPNGSGIAPDRDIPVTFGDDGGIRWKVPLPGIGNSSPIVSKGRLFIQSASEDGRERWLLALDPANGKTIWKRTVAGAKASTHNKNTLATSTPASDGERVFALFWDGMSATLNAYTHAGDSLWSRDLGRFQSEHGFGASPMTVGGLVFVNFDQDRSANILAFDAKTGEPRWKAERRGHRTCYSTPFIRERPGQTAELVVTSTTAISAYDPATGRQLWNHDWDWSYTQEPLRTVGSSVVWRDLVFAYSGNGGGNSHLLALRIPPEGKPTIAWEKKKGFPYVPSLLIAGDRLFAVTDRGGIAGCYDPATGREAWNSRLGGSVSASPIVINGKVYAANEEGTVFVFGVAETFELLARNELHERVIASPAVADGRLYFRGDKHLFCIGK